MKSIFFIFLMLPALLFAKQKTIVEKYGKLQVHGTHILGEYGDTVQLRGMSLFWSQWMPKYYNAKTIKWLKDDWKCTVIRAAMGVESGGYLKNPEQEVKKVEAVIEACIKEGIYVIVDYHAHEAHKNKKAAKKFFSRIASKYGQYPNVIYETYNEPLGKPEWDSVLKPYHESVIASIRKHDEDNLIICGTRLWSQRVDEAALNPIQDHNLAYTLHYYAVSHRENLRKTASKALAAGIPIFISEHGNCNAQGNGEIDKEEANKWYAFMDKHKISWCKWSVADKVETASILKPGASPDGNWSENQLTESGKFVRDELRAKNKKEFSDLK